ncbi:fimbrial protein [Pseudomonas sp. NBRC 111124]|uniref:fimbrial protein n=1 Tax=Pseudomonas sp. NBRC 111124 TaxID=1661039 RepID=UPI00076201ED|nr:fimbrial protein [Pseudomonas sp. NBRC 111124]
MRPQRYLPSLLALGLALGVQLISPSQAHAITGCTWQGASGPVSHSVNLGDFWVPRDAAVGTIIGSRDRLVSKDPLNREIRCDNDGIGVLTFQMAATLPVHGAPLPPINGWDVTGKVMETGIHGVGLYIRLNHPYTGANNGFRPVDDVAIPYEGRNTVNISPTPLLVNDLNANYYLIKTGPIPAGHTRFNTQAATGTITDLGSALRLSVGAGVNQAQCTLKADAVSDNPVLLGSHDAAIFTKPGDTSPPVNFHITLSDCEDDPAGSVARAHIRLEGALGSTVIDPSLGLFSLSDSTPAPGIAIQLLRSDSSPMTLEQDEPVTWLTIGNTRLDFKARYYQIGPKVSAGTASGALNFTISYR